MRSSRSTLTLLHMIHTPVVCAWGSMTHETIGYIAQDLIKDSTAAWAKNILSSSASSSSNDTPFSVTKNREAQKNENDDYLAAVAPWADSYRDTDEGKWSAPLHFLDVHDDPPSTCGEIALGRDCGAHGCTITAVSNYTSQILKKKPSRLSPPQRAEALKFLIHFIGDATQPLHNEAYELGGNDIPVTFQNYSGDNLHSVWDTWIPERIANGSSSTAAREWAGDLVRKMQSGLFPGEDVASWTEGDDNGLENVEATATRWAADANRLVCSTVMPDGAGVLEDGGDLFPGYYGTVVDTVEIQIAKAGARLANWLDMLAKAEEEV